MTRYEITYFKINSEYSNREWCLEPELKSTLKTILENGYVDLIGFKDAKDNIAMYDTSCTYLILAGCGLEKLNMRQFNKWWVSVNP